MTHNFKSFLSNRVNIIPDETPVETDIHPPFLLWGFTIYRTYDGGCDLEWTMLLETIRLHQAAHTILSLFHLDPRSEPKLLGMDMDQLRAVYDDPDAPGGGKGMHADGEGCRGFFLMADAEVLEGVADGSFAFKIVEVD
ncbi:hypothetical protein S7711_10855 [Stachybotrys chartarum IBT 7711]|uniref:Uncharacterized protein n=1 Tax=Stachybotrys chartarum (strain CBS 109288 / IBT 7711) TaxID=1280523 RepID=A0A084BAA1_STACB|nr:hypothetical protein S7711_10855 [Stachybotrys chartarum IBT 7711]KFA76906.1 hypothetical protein S40288_06208 [Stachybotrys chartarum IBT 40288]